MPVARNKNTTQQPMSTIGRTGAQSIQFIPAPRVYIKDADVLVSTPVESYFTKSNGVTPSGWTDLGIVDGKAVVSYTKKSNDVKTGLDQVLRATYTTEKAATMTFSLGQFDDVALETISSLTASVIVSSSVVNYQVGQDDITQKAILLVVQNKLDSKEWQFYNPAAYLNFGFDDSGNSMLLKCTVTLPFFTANGNANGESVLSVTAFA